METWMATLLESLADEDLVVALAAPELDHVWSQMPLLLGSCCHLCCYNVSLMNHAEHCKTACCLPLSAHLDTLEWLPRQTSTCHHCQSFSSWSWCARTHECCNRSWQCSFMSPLMLFWVSCYLNRWYSSFWSNIMLVPICHKHQLCAWWDQCIVRLFLGELTCLQNHLHYLTNSGASFLAHTKALRMILLTWRKGWMLKQRWGLWVCVFRLVNDHVHVVPSSRFLCKTISIT